MAKYIDLSFLLSNDLVESTFDMVDLVVVDFEGFVLERINQMIRQAEFTRFKKCLFRRGPKV